MVTIVTPDAYDNACTEVWFDPALLDTEDPELAEQAAITASWALWALSGYRFHGPQCWVEDYRTIRGYCYVTLEQWPVVDVFEVSRVDICADTVGITGIGDVVSGWCYRGNGELQVCCSDGSSRQTMCDCSASGSVVRVHYRTGNNLPPGADKAALRLAGELVLAASGDEECMLPERVTSITRQGATWTILDPQDFLEDGLTGIGPVDQWLAQTGLRSRWVKFVDPLRSVPLVSSTLVGCGEDDCFADL